MAKFLIVQTSSYLATSAHCRTIISSSRAAVPHYRPLFLSRPLSVPRRPFCIKAFDAGSNDALEKEETKSGNGGREEYPSGEFSMKEFSGWETFLVKLRMLIAFPWQRVKKGSVLTIKLRGQISDQLKSRFSSGLSLPQICENFEKAMYDPRISGIYLYVLLPLNKGHSDQMKQNCLPSQHNMHINSFEIRQLFQDQWLWRRWKSLRKEEFAQGRVWTGGDAASRGLVDAIGGFSRAVAIAKEKANIPQDKQVTLVEMSRPSPTLPELLSGMGSSLVGVDRTLKELLQGLAWSEGVQARMDGIVFQRMEGASIANPIFSLIKDYLSSL